MTKLLVENPQGVQELIEVGEGGAYYDDTKVLWDERKDGEFPSDKIQHAGYLKRSGKNLVQDNPRKAQFQAAKDAEAAAKLKEKDDKAARKAILKDLKDVQDPAVKSILKAIIDELGLDKN